MKLVDPAFGVLFLLVNAIVSGCGTADSVTKAPLNISSSNIASVNATPRPSPTPHSNQNVADDGASEEEARPTIELMERCKHAPVGKAKVTPLTGKAPLTVTFDGTASYDPDGTKIVSWKWFFGDFQSGEGRKTNYTYEKPGTYGIGLDVTDAQGQKTSGCGTGATEIRVTVTE